VKLIEIVKTQTKAIVFRQMKGGRGGFLKAAAVVAPKPVRSSILFSKI